MRKSNIDEDRRGFRKFEVILKGSFDVPFLPQVSLCTPSHDVKSLLRPDYILVRHGRSSSLLKAFCKAIRC